MVPRCEAAADGVSADVIDLRTLMPWDSDMVLDSVRRTRRCLIVHEDLRTGGFGAEIAAVVADEAFLDLDAPVARVTMPDIPSPHHPDLAGMRRCRRRSAFAPRSTGWWGFDVIDVRVPDEQEGTKAVVRAWLKQVGDTVAVNDPLVELETDKVTQEVPAPAAGVLAEILLETDAEAVPGALLGRISSSPAQAGAQEAKPVRCFGEVSACWRSWTPACAGEQCRDTPLPLRAPGVAAAWDRPVAHRRAPAATDASRARMSTARWPRRRSSASASPRPPSRGRLRAGDIPHDRMRLMIAENMVRAVSEAPHVTALFEADFSAVAAHKAALRRRRA